MIRSVPKNCNINENDGYCRGVMELDKREAKKTVHCSCDLFGGATSFCRWADKDTHEQVYALASRFFKQSPRCHRKYMARDILEIDWFHARMCTDMKLGDFDEMASMAHKWIYAAPMASKVYDSDCLNVFAVTGTEQLM